MKIKMKHILFTLIFCLSVSGASFRLSAQERKISKTERHADENFIRQKFDKAMKQYETSVKRETDEKNRALIHIKSARLYYMLRNYGMSSAHYEEAVKTHPELFSVEEMCNYIDALRFSGENKKAEALCLNYTYNTMYSKRQRYQNIHDALTKKHVIVPDERFTAKKLSINGDNSEFWIGKFMGQLFYAKSFSPFNDQWKQFFHRVRYYEIEADNVEKDVQKAPRYNEFFRRIPVDMQNGALTFSPDMKTMVTTVVRYKNPKTTIEQTEKESRPFRTKLFYSILKDNEKRYSRYRPVFEQEEASSYAHPILFNNGKSLLFASDMEGGYGGFDLYVTHFDEDNLQWSLPVNLGPEVNTDGDEISPTLFDNRLLFASNGHPGYGGYDLFSVYYEKETALTEGLYHFPYPVNSVFNDYFLYPTSLHEGYFVSDRDLHSQDDIYYLKSNDEFGAPNTRPFFGMHEDNILAGGQPMLNELLENPLPETVELKYAPKGLLLTLYFEFDSELLTPESIGRLSNFLHETKEYRFSGLYIDGFADEMGGKDYNDRLSERRALNVADYLRDQGVGCRFHVIGHGRQKLTPSELETELAQFTWSELLKPDWIQINRRARRVEIHNR